MTEWGKELKGWGPKKNRKTLACLCGARQVKTGELVEDETAQRCQNTRRKQVGEDGSDSKPITKRFGQDVDPLSRKKKSTGGG